MSRANMKAIAALAMVAALLLADGVYGADWPSWVRGTVLGLLASVTVNYIVKAANAPAGAGERDHQDAR